LGHAIVYVSGVGYYDDTTWKALTGPDFNKAPGDTGSVYNYADGPGSRPAGTVNQVVRAPVIKTIQDPPKVINIVPAPPTPTQNPQNPTTPAATTPTVVNNNTNTDVNQVVVSNNKPTNTPSTPAVTVVVPEQLVNTVAISEKIVYNINPSLNTSTKPANWKFIISDWDIASCTLEDMNELRYLETEWKTASEKDKNYIYEEVEKIRSKYRLNGIIYDDGLGNIIINSGSMRFYILNKGSFTSETAAVYAFGIAYLPLSKNHGKEYGAAIHQHYHGKPYSFEQMNPSNYTYTISVVQGNERSVDLTNAAKYNDPNSRTVAFVHTHWASNGDLFFTPNTDYAPLTNTQMYPYVNNVYLVNREGDIIKSSRYYETDKRGNKTLTYDVIDQYNYADYLIFSLPGYK